MISILDFFGTEITSCLAHPQCIKMSQVAKGLYLSSPSLHNAIEQLLVAVHVHLAIDALDMRVDGIL